ncbi:S8 family serine peptidase [uncultured Dokdonia sp.]|uniref:S8 family serine peptidase n=1 Tax=uncultured Dokdonia sp. TaxID=575653 RepID=UPI0026279B65|nr:S8 family serine peptidase [uncultured Dokdonia sp.]
MKKRFFLFIGIVFVCFSCTTNENDFLENSNFIILQNDEYRDSEAPEIVSSFADSPESDTVPLDEIIIKYQPEVSEAQKETLRNEYGVIHYRTCDCINGNQKYELWVLDQGVVTEPTVKVIKRKNDDQVDFVAQNQGYDMPLHAVAIESEDPSEDPPGDPSEVVYIESSFNNDYLNRIVSTNDGITVAVLDTGVDTEQVGFIGDFLYNSALNGNCGEESGWDFVNQDKNTYDDNDKKHGTVVSYIIHNQLKNTAVKHQILPVKIADADGKSTFFNTLCGLEYAIDKESDVINLSFGWETSDLNIYNMFSDLIDTTDAIIVTSAGNKNQDNNAKPHYPSNFSQDYVLAIAAAKDDLSDATFFSNYGASMVDFYAIGNKITFPLKNPNTFSYFRGTSFAAPFVSAKVAELLSNNSQNIRVDLSQQFAVSVDYFSKPVQYMQIIK